jgi:hypothetical protein
VELDDAAADAPAVRLAPLPHGRVLLFGFGGCDRLRALSPQLEPVWGRRLDQACASQAAAAVLTSAAEVVVTGSFRGRADFGAGQVATAAGELPDAFVLGLSP